MARMGWNPDSPTNALRVSLLVYLRHQLRWLEERFPPPAEMTEIAELRVWIAWLDGDEVPT
jgi:hypothetical protein